MSDQDRERFYALRDKARSVGLTLEERAEVKLLAPRFAPIAQPQIGQSEPSSPATLQTVGLDPALIETNQRRDLESWWLKASVDNFLADFGNTDALAQ